MLNGNPNFCKTDKLEFFGAIDMNVGICKAARPNIVTA